MNAITFEADKFEELVSKVHSIFCQFPIAKECKMAILGLSEMEDLNDGMEEVVESFGSTDACDFALRVVQAKWRPFLQVGNNNNNDDDNNKNTIASVIQITRDSRTEEQTLDLLALLYYNAKSFRGEIRWEAGLFRLSPIVKLAITCLLHKNAELMKRDGCNGFVACLDIRRRLSNPQVKEALDDAAFSGLFTTLNLAAHVFEYNGYTGNFATEETEVSNEDVDRVLCILQKGLGMEELKCTSGGIRTRFTKGLIDLLKQGRIRKLALECVTWQNVNESIQHICAGLEAWKEDCSRTITCNNSSGLVEFKMRDIPRATGWGEENMCRLIKALEGVSTLQQLHLRLDGKICNSVVRSLKDLFSHPQCKLVELAFGGRGIQTDDGDDCSDTDLKELCNAIARCTSMRTLTIFLYTTSPDKDIYIVYVS